MRSSHEEKNQKLDRRGGWINRKIIIMETSSVTQIDVAKNHSVTEADKMENCTYW